MDGYRYRYFGRDGPWPTIIETGISKCLRAIAHEVLLPYL